MASYRYEHSVSFYASQLDIPLNKRCIIVKRELGHRVLEIIDSILVLDAKFLLTDTPIKMTYLTLPL